MAYRIPVAMGYHGFELRDYDELGGRSSRWNNLLAPNLIDLLAIRFLILQAPQPVPGYHQVVGASATSFGTSAVLYERDTIPAYARVIVAAAKLPEVQVVPTILDPRFPVNGAVLLPDTSSAQVGPLSQPLPMSRVVAVVTEWTPGRMTIALRGADTTASHLLIAENWYPDWHATVDGQPGVVRRADHTLISVDLPPGARQVQVWFSSPTYARGKMLSLFALAIAIAMAVGPIIHERRKRSPARA
jgi:hypothetical protein